MNALPHMIGLNLILGKHYFRYIHSCDFTNHFISISQKSPDIGAEPRGVSTTATVSVSGDFYLASGQVRLNSFAARWTLLSCAMLASVLCL